ncbi:hypothetical protein IB229_12890 [Pseudomonas sp. PDM14]|uniref:hypothetical protein n=1 Tax=Pseudomonas sp. PDM14 TaxID=2769288 RepID=UPI00177C8E4B|nr:hypothetical protein [Pseudomonas sp. PDM14]MBD9483875.1 hypothetical protein [Pseudomonas sp. PDM14]
MQLNVIRGERATGKTTRLRQLAAEAGHDEAVIIAAPHFSEFDLGLLIRGRLHRGHKIVLIDDCSPEQIHQLEKLQPELPDSLTIHAVAQAGS